MPNAKDDQIQELKARLYAVEQTLAHMSQVIHTLFKGDVKLGPQATQKIIDEVKAMPGGSGTL